MLLEKQTRKELNEKSSRCVLIQANASKRKIYWVWPCTKRRVLTRKRMGRIVKATISILRKKKRTSGCHESEWFDCDLAEIENLPYDIDDTCIYQL